MYISAEASFVSISTAIFFILNATGQIPLFLALLGRFDPKKQRKIITREMIIALVILLLFTFYGDTILQLLGITRPIIGVAGGILLFLISLGMIFPKKNSVDVSDQQEPLIIPLAIPVIAGPGAITTVMVFTHETASPLLVAFALVAAWIPSLILLLLGSSIKQLLGERGLAAVERLGGMLICLIGLQMFTEGTFLLVKEYFKIGVL